MKDFLLKRLCNKIVLFHHFELRKKILTKGLMHVVSSIKIHDMQSNITLTVENLRLRALLQVDSFNLPTD